MDRTQTITCIHVARSLCYVIPEMARKSPLLPANETHIFVSIKYRNRIGSSGKHIHYHRLSFTRGYKEITRAPVLTVVTGLHVVRDLWRHIFISMKNGTRRAIVFLNSTVPMKEKREKRRKRRCLRMRL